MTDIYHRPPLFKQLNAALAMMFLPDMSWVLMMLRDYLLKSTVFQWANIEHTLRGANKIHGSTPILFLIPNGLNRVNFLTNFCPKVSYRCDHQACDHQAILSYILVAPRHSLPKIFMTGFT